ncbi:MAG TPA: S41 family peptidase [Patescibacteria group bacterium]|nr:S41 family peptidase [Patescibacteria group bacterium]
MTSNFKTLRNVVLALLLVGAGGVAGFKLGRGENIPFLSSAVNSLPSSRLVNTAVPASHSSVDFTQFWAVWDRLEQNYYDPTKLDTTKMVNGAISGMTASLGDPYTMYLPPDDQKRTSDDLNGSFDGVGIQLGYKNQTLVVIAPLKGLPAEKAGVQAGDYILHIKDPAKNVDKDTSGISLPNAVDLIRGPKGSTVTLTFLRTGGKPEEKTLTRDTITVPSVELTFIPKGNKQIAHIKLTQFGGNTDAEWNDAVGQIVAKGSAVSGIILDVRNNPGGYLQEAVAIASEFIPDGVVVKQQGKTESIPYYSSGKGRLTNYPVVVLINKGSASASEIVSGALRDRKNAKLIGENSFGKGTVQDAQELPNGAGLHITIAKWLMPGGDWIHEIGIKPTIEVKLPDDFGTNADAKDTQLDSAVAQF